MALIHEPPTHTAGEFPLRLCGVELAHPSTAFRAEEPQSYPPEIGLGRGDVEARPEFLAIRPVGPYSYPRKRTLIGIRRLKARIVFQVIGRQQP